MNRQNTEFTKLLVPSPQTDGSDRDKGFISGHSFDKHLPVLERVLNR
jgi:hypothetical protein